MSQELAGYEEEVQNCAEDYIRQRAAAKRFDALEDKISDIEKYEIMLMKHKNVYRLLLTIAEQQKESSRLA
jgi:hypothetical protein